MRRLLAVEMRRLGARRLVRWSLLLVFLGVLAAPAVVPWAFHEQARTKHDADIERCVQGKPPKIRDGVQLPTIPPEVAAPAERERLCRKVTPALEPKFHLRQLDQVYRTTAPLLISGAFVVGASSAGADWHAGLMPTVLTWESRRRRVFIARLAAIAAAVFVIVVLWQALLAAAVLPGTLAVDTTDGTGGQWPGTISGLGLRTAAVAVGAAVFGFALAMIGRSTAAALGIGFAYMFVVENVVGSQFKPLRPWLMLWNALVFTKGTFEAGGDVPGRTVTGAGLVLAVWAAVLVGIAAVLFQRRDVT